MKKTLFILLIVGTTCYGQSKEQPINDQNRTEVKLNVFSGVLSALDIEIERTLSQRSSIGLSFFTNFKNPEDSNEFNNQHSVSAFYRYYMGKKYAQGFFVEGFGMYNTSHYLNPMIAGNINFRRRYQVVNDFGLGAGIGYKWVSKKGLILQSNFGLGTNLFNSESGESVIGRAGISIGYRF